MQKLRLPFIAALFVLCIYSTQAPAQDRSPAPPQSPGREGGAMRPPHPADQDLPKLTDQQNDQIRKIHLALAEKTLPLRNELSEKEAHLRTLMTAREADRNAIDKAADEIGNIRKELFKARVESDVRINEVLTEEQKAFRNMRPEGPGPLMPPPEDPAPMMH